MAVYSIAYYPRLLAMAIDPMLAPFEIDAELSGKSFVADTEGGGRAARFEGVRAEKVLSYDHVSGGSGGAVATGRVVSVQCWRGWRGQDVG